MQVIVIGGILGGGKTTTIINMSKYLATKGKKVAIIINEVGEIKIEREVIKKFGFDTREITSGCICCTLKMGLRVTVSDIVKRNKPDILIIEPTSIAFPSTIKNELKLMNLGDEIKIISLITLVDGSRFKNVMKETKDFATRQIVDAEILGINKVDLIENMQIPILEASIQKLNPKAKVTLLSGKDADERFENFMQLVLPGIDKIPNQELSLKDQETEEKFETPKREFENSIVASQVGSYSTEFFIKNGETLSKENARVITTEIMNKIKEQVLTLNPEFLGHIKLFLNNGSEIVKQSITVYYEDPQEDIFKSKEGATSTLKILSAVLKVEKEDLKNTVNSSVQETFEKMGIEIHQVKHSHDHHHGHDHHHEPR